MAIFSSDDEDEDLLVFDDEDSSDNMESFEDEFEIESDEEDEEANKDDEAEEIKLPPPKPRTVIFCLIRDRHPDAIQSIAMQRVVGTNSNEYQLVKREVYDPDRQSYFVNGTRTLCSNSYLMSRSICDKLFDLYQSYYQETDAPNYFLEHTLDYLIPIARKMRRRRQRQVESDDLIQDPVDNANI